MVSKRATGVRLWQLEGPIAVSDVLGLIPQLSWVLLAIIALAAFYKPAVKLMDESRISKFGVGAFEVEITQQTVARIKDTNIPGIPRTYKEFKPIAIRALSIQDKLKGAVILWVDSYGPSQNILERHALESLGIRFDLVSSTEEALQWMDKFRYDAVISNLSRDSEGDANKTPCFSGPLPAGAGCVMAKKMHELYADEMPPVIF